MCGLPSHNLLQANTQYCSWNAPFPTNVIPLNYTVSFTNMTNDENVGDFFADDLYPNEFVEASVNINSPGAQVHDFYINTQNNVNVDSVLINDRVIYTNLNNATFSYVFPNDNKWTLSVKYTPGNFPPDSTLQVEINSNYDQLYYSQNLQDLVNKLPDWATFVGRGRGLISVLTTLYIPLD